MARIEGELSKAGLRTNSSDILLTSHNSLLLIPQLSRHREKEYNHESFPIAGGQPKHALDDVTL